ncbi:MAG: tRNA (N(6)-L-threonylcarbamoyladenosine(37)-C(2))-methylthiotransferase MtaB [Candidatus Paracaedimonas acanthamoebae]|uniref:tRNA (N(6)-L-threonylcarbamoyladenosine(37)-C(2))-methylthiotransferase MtaB n=1 Tax=Candidatus Paracaedimonas acanthamoebae TaxID=244581 RepID=A0A8J7PRQ9_9PROT|nr:tRNA (N(6)-L-threonylcarbamoyladenosine(37)-C(2))-methylthiotransferase MtaB [Candidatus Paracaedimonas acanthamoebae]
MSQHEAELITFGCRLNAYESEVMRSHARAQGLENAIIINTCSVTNEAERQARQAIRKARKENPTAMIIVTGCSAQQNPDLYSQMPEVDRVLGNHEKMQVESFSPLLSTKILLSDIMQVRETAIHLVSGFENHVRAFIEIQNGCDHRCTFCSIPFGRGPNRSIPIAEIVRQIKHLVTQGCKEVVFTGVDITGYGADLPGKPTLAQMIKRTLSQVPKLERLRLSSLDPIEIDPDLIALFGTEPRLMPHVHLSLQAGDNMILKRMKRRHLREDALDVCKRLRAIRQDIIFGADFIAGFPTETEEMFKNTLNIVEECDISYLHVFPYSARRGTPAARMPQVPKEIIKTRASTLREMGKKRLHEFLQMQLNRSLNVLVERNFKGHTDHFAPVQLVGDHLDDNWVGKIIPVKVIEVTSNKLKAIANG